MTWLAPLGFLGLLTLPVLVWLWRLASTQRRLPVASLIPFEHLLRRASRRRRRVVLTVLFWCQLAMLVIASLALARPGLRTPPRRTTLMVLDTSASMQAPAAAGGRGPTRFAQAQRALTAALRRLPSGDDVLLVTTAPPDAVNVQPTGDGNHLAFAVEGQRIAEQGGDVGVALQLGVALLGRAPDQIIAATDQPPPEGMPEAVRWIRVGVPQANVALTGIEAMAPLCRATDARVVATVQNFSAEPAAIRLTARHDERVVTEETRTLAPQERQAVALRLPEALTGLIEVRLDGSPDHLPADNRAWVQVVPGAPEPVALRVADPALSATLAGWLAACEALSWDRAGPLAETAVLLSDDAALAGSHPAMLFLGGVAPAAAQPRYWLPAPDHPISAYLNPIDLVRVPLTMSGEAPGVPVISALVDGRRVPVVTAAAPGGVRRVTMGCDPRGEAETPVLLVFFNALRWLMGDVQPATTRDALTTGGWAPGSVTIRAPDGATASVPVTRGVVRLETLSRAGRYVFSQPGREQVEAVNFFDPVESDLLREAIRPWSALGVALASAEPAARPRAPVTRPLAGWLLAVLLIGLVGEWGLYCREKR